MGISFVRKQGTIIDKREFKRDIAPFTGHWPSSCKSIVLAFAVACLFVFVSPSVTGIRNRALIPEASPQTTPRGKTAHPELLKAYGKLPLSFEANQGQTARQVKFLSRGTGYTLFLTENAAVLALKKGAPVNRERLMRLRLPAAMSQASNPMALLREPAPLGAESAAGHDDQGEAKTAGAVVRMRLVGANPAARISGVEELPGKSNYFIGKNPKEWQTDVPTYARVKYQGVYPGVDLVYYGNQRQLEYDFVVAPGVDPGTIRLGVDARNSIVEIAKNGDLVIRLGQDEVRFRKPVVYQSAVPVTKQRHNPDSLHSSLAARHFLPGRFVLLANNEVGFKVADYDRTRPLVIDPTLAYSTYLGGTSGGADKGYGIAADSTGSAYVTGETASADFPTTSGAFQTTFVGGTCTTVSGQTETNRTCSDAFVAKLNPSGTALVYSTFIGGSGSDQGLGIAVDSSGAAYLAGDTSSSDFPLVNPIQAISSTTANGFVAKLNPAGNGLAYSTYLGSAANAIAVDSKGSAYVTGSTSALYFPLVNPVQDTLRGSGDAFVAKLNAAGTALVYSTYLGGSNNSLGDSGMGIAVDSAGYAYVTGMTYSSDFPTVNPLQAAYGNNGDVFVAKLNPAGGALVYSTYLGGSGIDWPFGVAADSSGSAYVVGWTFSTDFPTANAMQAALSGTVDAFVTKLNADGTAMLYSTYLGGSGNDLVRGITVDFAGSAYVVGGTGSTDFPTANSLQAASPNGDAFLAKLNAAGSALDFSTYLGGTGTETGYAVSLDTSGNAYIAGVTGGGVFPTTPGALQTQGPSTANCVNWPSGYVPFTQITSNTGELVVGYTTMDAFQQLTTIPMPAFAGEGFCTLAELAAGQYFLNASVPTAAERNGDFSSFSTPIINPYTGQPFEGNIIPSNMLGSVFAWPISDGLPPPSSAFVAKISGFPAAVPALTLSPASVDFGSVVVSSPSSVQTVTLSNSGGSSVTINSITITGAHSGDFSQTNTCGNSLAAESSCTISVTFTPTAEGSRGAMLSVSHGAANSPQMVSLSGKGQDFALTARTTSRSILSGATANFDLLLSPHGGFNQSVDLSCSGGPSNSTCTVTPASITLDGTNPVAFKLTVSTGTKALLPPGGPGNFVPPLGSVPLAVWLALFSLLGLMAFARFRPSGSRLKRLAPFATLALLVTLWAACGGGGSSSSATPAGSYSLTVTATSGSLTHTSEVTLNVQ